MVLGHFGRLALISVPDAVLVKTPLSLMLSFAAKIKLKSQQYNYTPRNRTNRECPRHQLKCLTGMHGFPGAYALLCVANMTAMEISGLCERCGNICSILYAPTPPRLLGAKSLDRVEAVWTITVTCPRCGQYRLRTYSAACPPTQDVPTK